MTAHTTPLPWYHAGLRFSCTQCGNCCSGAPGYVWVTTADMDRIAEFLGQPVEQFQRRHVRRVGMAFSLRELRGGDCEFLDRQPDGKTLCRIHSVRPIQCRTWPFWQSNVSSPEEWADTAKNCPGMNQGELHTAEFIQERLDANGKMRL